VRVRGVVAVAALGLALCAGGSVGAAAAPSVGGFNCGTTNSIGGHPWAIMASGISCRTARGVVRQLAGKTVPRSAIKSVGFFPGTYAGLRCFGGPTGKKPVSVTCGKSGTDKLLRAGRLR
jgi:hypothetical protein